MPQGMRELLFIDDEEAVRRSVLRALRREPYRVDTVESGEAGVAAVREDCSRFDAVISDYKMPGMDGMETLITIGRINPEITRIILTGYATMEAAIEATNQGIDGFLTKPFDNVQLRASIRDIYIRRCLRQFVPEQVYREIGKFPAALAPRFTDATVLFSDIRGFTEMTQQVSPDAIAGFLNERYFTPMGEIACEHGGMVDKHIGDGMMVVFGTPLSKEDDPHRAVATAVAMQQKAKEIDRRLSAKNGLRLHTGVGVCTGEVFSGMVGSLRRKEFTSIGVVVNIAYRLQALAHAGEIMLCRETYDKVCRNFCALPLGPVRVKGMAEPIEVYRIRI